MTCSIILSYLSKLRDTTFRIAHRVHVKAKITNSDQSHKSQIEYKKQELGKHGPLETPKVGSGA